MNTNKIKQIGGVVLGIFILAGGPSAYGDPIMVIDVNNTQVTSVYDKSTDGDTLGDLAGTYSSSGAQWADPATTAYGGSHGGFFNTSGTATWTASGYVEGQTVEVYMCWFTQHNTDATAHYSVTDQTGTTNLVVNQLVVAASDLIVNDGTRDLGFESFGIYKADANGTVTVVLTSDGVGGEGEYESMDAAAFRSPAPVDPLPPVWNESPVTGDPALAGRAYTGTLAGKANDPNGGPITYSRDASGPAWLAVASDGTLSGTPTTTGTNTFTVMASDADSSTPETLHIVVVQPSPPVWDEDPITGLSGRVDAAYSDTLAGKATDSEDDPISYSRDLSGPTWLAVAPDGTLSGTPTASGLYSFTVMATDIDGSTSATLNLYIGDLPETILIDNVTGNGGFETPGTGSGITPVSDEGIHFWDNWSEVGAGDSGTYDGGVGPYYTYIGNDGGRVAYLGATGAAMVNMATNIPYTIQTGDIIFYSFNNVLLDRAPATISLAYDDAGVRTQIAGTEIPAMAGTTGFGIFVVQAGDDWVGSTLGVGLVSGGAYPEVDQVVLGYTRPTADPVYDLSITGPISGGTEMVLSWTGEKNGIYGVETNSNLIDSDWQSFTSNIPGIDGIMTITNTIGPDQSFYRVISE